MSVTDLLAIAGLTALGAPVMAALALTASFLAGLSVSERAIARTVSSAFGLSFLATLAVDAAVLASAETHVTLAHWMTLPRYQLDASVVFDGPSAVLMTLTAMLCGLIGAFSAPYLHADPGYRRFFVLLSLFGSGMMAIAAGETLDLVFAGWEVVGLASAMLIAYFSTREPPVRHGLRAFATYRICDVGLLTAAILMHHHGGEALFDEPLEGSAGPLVSLLLALGVMGKSASVPFTGWLPRAMEGPTPSSAIFYGALSIHAGPYLLIRAWSLIEGQEITRYLILLVGLLTAAHATMVGRVQTDAKTRAGYASAAQVGVMFVEIGIGLPELALLHIAGHAFLRTWQLLRTPSLLHDHHQLSALIGGSPPPSGTHWERLLPEPARRFGFELALSRWYLDDIGAALLGPIRSALSALEAADRSFAETLSQPLRAEPRREGKLIEETQP